MAKKKKKQEIDPHQRTLIPFLQVSSSSSSPTDSNLWPNPIKPFSDELLSSWMARLSLANLTNLGLLVKHFDYKPYLFDYDVEYNEALMNQFSEKVGISNEILKSHALIHEKNSLDQFITAQVDSVRVSKSLTFTTWNQRGKNGLRFCPLCLKHDETPFFRKNWRFIYTSFCPIHNCFLENSCPNCGTPILLFKIKWDGKLYKCFKCKTDLRNISPTYITVQDNLHESYKQFLLQNQIKSKKIFLIITISWFLANFCDLTDNFYGKHPITARTQNVNLWRKHGRGVSKIALFSNTQLCYLYFRYAVYFLYHDSHLIPFFRKYYINSKLFHQSGTFFCIDDLCNFQTENFGEFLVHLNLHNSNTPDFELYQEESSQYIDLQSIINETFYICEICEKTFKFESDLNAHYRKHEEKDGYHCRFCELKFERKDELVEHYSLKHPERFQFICKKCGIGYINKSSLRMHKKWKHPKL